MHQIASGAGIASNALFVVDIFTRINEIWSSFFAFFEEDCVGEEKEIERKMIYISQLFSGFTIPLL